MQTLNEVHHDEYQNVAPSSEPAPPLHCVASTTEMRFQCLVPRLPPPASVPTDRSAEERGRACEGAWALATQELAGSVAATPCFVFFVTMGGVVGAPQGRNWGFDTHTQQPPLFLRVL